MPNPIRVHLHIDNPIRTKDSTPRLETLCEEFRPEERCVPVEEYRRWLGQSKTPLIFCGHCRAALL